jgi:ssDNA-binding replication factor A large subunit
MNAELQALLRAVVTTLREDVRPHVQDEQARIQLAAVFDVLGKLEGMTAWAPDALRQQAQALQAGAQAFEARAAQADLRLPAANASADAPELQ